MSGDIKMKTYVCYTEALLRDWFSRVEINGMITVHTVSLGYYMRTIEFFSIIITRTTFKGTFDVSSHLDELLLKKMQPTLRKQKLDLIKSLLKNV